MAIIKKFTVGSKRAKEGDWIDVSWECGIPDAVYLSTDNGYKTDRISLADTGSTRVYISKSKGSTKVTLMAVLGATKESKTETIHVTNVKTVKAKPAGIGKFQLWKEKMHARWCQTKAQLQCWWQYLPKKKKTIYKVLFFLWLALLAASIIVPSSNRHHSGTAPTEQVAV